MRTSLRCCQRMIVLALKHAHSAGVDRAFLNVSVKARIAWASLLPCVVASKEGPICSTSRPSPAATFHSSLVQYTKRIREITYRVWDGCLGFHGIPAPVFFLRTHSSATSAI